MKAGARLVGKASAQSATRSGMPVCCPLPAARLTPAVRTPVLRQSVKHCSAEGRTASTPHGTAFAVCEQQAAEKQYMSRHNTEVQQGDN